MITEQPSVCRLKKRSSSKVHKFGILLCVFMWKQSEKQLPPLNRPHARYYRNELWNSHRIVNMPDVPETRRHPLSSCCPHAIHYRNGQGNNFYRPSTYQTLRNDSLQQTVRTKLPTTATRTTQSKLAAASLHFLHFKQKFLSPSRPLVLLKVFIIFSTEHDSQTQLNLTHKKSR